VFESLIRVLQIPDRVTVLEARMSELTDAYTAMASAVNETVGELDGLVRRVAALEGESAPVAADLRALADRLRNAYTEPPAEPTP
jgi:hypothetical protein